MDIFKYINNEHHISGLQIPCALTSCSVSFLFCPLLLVGLSTLANTKTYHNGTEEIPYSSCSLQFPFLFYFRSGQNSSCMYLIRLILVRRCGFIKVCLSLTVSFDDSLHYKLLKLFAIDCT